MSRRLGVRPQYGATAPTGSILAWGMERSGSQGLGTFAQSQFGLVPQVVINSSDVIGMACSWTDTYVLKSNGEVWACGNADGGTLGNGSREKGRAILEPIEGLPTIKAVGTSSGTAWFLSTSNEVWGVGGNITAGLRGQGYRNEFYRPRPALTGPEKPLTEVQALCNTNCSAFGIYFLRKDGSVWMGGKLHFQMENVYTEAVPFTATKAIREAEFESASPIAGFVGNYLFAIVLLADGTIRTKGGGEAGERANGEGLAEGVGGEGTKAWATRKPCWHPVLPGETSPGVFEAGKKGVEITGSYYNGYVRHEDGTVSSWGNNKHGQLGNGTVGGANWLVPKLVPGLTNIVSIRAAGEAVAASNQEQGKANVLTIKEDSVGDRRVWAWGGNHEGQQGDGTTEDKATPHEILGKYAEGVRTPYTDIEEIACSEGHGAARRKRGKPPTSSIIQIIPETKAVTLKWSPIPGDIYNTEGWYVEWRRHESEPGPEEEEEEVEKEKGKEAFYKSKELARSELMEYTITGLPNEEAFINSLTAPPSAVLTKVTKFQCERIKAAMESRGTISVVGTNISGGTTVKEVIPAKEEVVLSAPTIGVAKETNRSFSPMLPWEQAGNELEIIIHMKGALPGNSFFGKPIVFATPLGMGPEVPQWVTPPQFVSSHNFIKVGQELTTSPGVWHGGEGKILSSGEILERKYQWYWKREGKESKQELVGETNSHYIPANKTIKWTEGKGIHEKKGEESEVGGTLVMLEKVRSATGTSHFESRTEPITVIP